MRGGQTQLGSAVETVVNTVTGFASAFVTQLVIMPFYGLHISFGQSFSMGLIFTVVSLVRSYFVRRLFNSLLVGTKWARRRTQPCYSSSLSPSYVSAQYSSGTTSGPGETSSRL